VICSDLFFGLDVFDINWLPGMVHEEPRNWNFGYSCFHDPSNSFWQHRFDLLQAILIHSSLWGQFHFVSKEQKLSGRQAPALHTWPSATRWRCCFFAEPRLALVSQRVVHRLHLTW
jgi:hypothetical protein